jgi:hypothetical protein
MELVMLTYEAEPLKEEKFAHIKMDFWRRETERPSDVEETVLKPTFLFRTFLYL